MVGARRGKESGLNLGHRIRPELNGSPGLSPRVPSGQLDGSFDGGRPPDSASNQIRPAPLFAQSTELYAQENILFTTR